MTGFYKKDRLIPVITLIVYFGADEWDGPRNLHQMFAVQNEKLLSYMPDYKINLLAPQEMSDEEIEQFQTDFCEVMLFCKYMKDKNKLKEILSTHPVYQNMEQKAIHVIEAVANIKVTIKESEGTGDVCIAIREMMDDAAMEEKKKAEEEKKRADEEKKKAEEEKKRADLAEESLRKERNKMALLKQLNREGRNEDIDRICTDEKYCQHLMKAYGLE